MTEQKKKQPTPTPEDSPILMTGYFGHELSVPVVLIWDPYGLDWRGLHTMRNGRPRKAWLEDKSMEAGLITEWARLRPEPEQVEKGQRIGVPGMTGNTPRADAPAVHFDQGGPGALHVPASSLFQKDSGLHYPQRIRGTDS